MFLHCISKWIVFGQELGALTEAKEVVLLWFVVVPAEVERAAPKEVALAARGLKGKAIARELDISPATVKTHFEHVFRKLGVSGRTAAVAQALRGGLIG